MVVLAAPPAAARVDRRWGMANWQLSNTASTFTTIVRRKCSSFRRERGCDDEVAGVVDHHVEPTEALEGAAVELLRVMAARDVGLGEHQPRRRHLGKDGLTLVGRTPAEHDGGALGQ